ncbi:hypothetical protein HDF16_005720 [Granulicella aggregans]|uniref:Uncharacterized protein n=1 Tax=Granulicella aggregans TaxID=474949 RepID=A0A7W7ZJB8_9BACT|nr:hypothetical protein [Granulicella aggregans]
MWIRRCRSTVFRSASATSRCIASNQRADKPDRSTECHKRRYGVPARFGQGMTPEKVRGLQVIVELRADPQPEYAERSEGEQQEEHFFVRSFAHMVPSLTWSDCDCLAQPSTRLEHKLWHSGSSSYFYQRSGSSCGL